MTTAIATEATPTNVAADDDDRAFCETCNAEMTDEELYDFGAYCAVCHAKTHFLCSDCGETLDNEEQSSRCKTRCLGCQEAKDEEELETKKDALRSEAEDLLASICVDGDLACLRRTVAALKRFQPT